MEALRVTAKLGGGVVCRSGPQLDTLLGASVARSEGRPQPTNAVDVAPIAVPLARSACDRFYLCSVGMFEVECVEKDWTNRRFPLERALMQSTMGSVDIKKGPQKSYRLPRERMHLRNDTMTWLAIGDGPAVFSLLVNIKHLGKRRSVGLGEIVDWHVEEIEPWEGFPVVSTSGAPLRPLPLDWPGVHEDSELAIAVLSDTARGVVSWAKHLEEELWVPSW
jgi:hypothetical protein